MASTPQTLQYLLLPTLLLCVCFCELVHAGAKDYKPSNNEVADESRLLHSAKEKSFSKFGEVEHPPFDPHWENIIHRNVHWPCQHAMDVMQSFSVLRLQDYERKLYGMPRKRYRTRPGTRAGSYNGTAPTLWLWTYPNGSRFTGVLPLPAEKRGPHSRSGHHGKSHKGRGKPYYSQSSSSSSSSSDENGKSPWRHYYDDIRNDGSPSYEETTQRPPAEDDNSSSIDTGDDDDNATTALPQVVSSTVSVVNSTAPQGTVSTVSLISRQRRSAGEDLETCLSTTMDLHVVNVHASAGAATLLVAGERFDLAYATSANPTVQLKATDTYTVIHNSGRIEYPLSNEHYGLPCNGDLYIATSRVQSTTNVLHAEVALFYPQPVKQLQEAQNATIFVYNALEMVGLPATVDVLFFSSHKAAHLMPALFRVSANMDLNSGTDAILPVGTYTIKVVRHNSVLTHCRFVRVNSLLPEVSIQVRAGMHYFITLHGKVDIRAYGVRGNDSSVRVPVYPSGLVTNRPADIRQKLWTSAKVFIINAFRSTRPILLRLVRKDFRVKLNYSEVKLFENVTIEEGDCFILLNRKDKYNPRGKVRDLVYNKVPANDAECFIVADHKAVGHSSGSSSLDIFFHCFDTTAVLPAPRYAEVVIYHALHGLKCDFVDVILKRKSLTGDDGDDDDENTALYTIASDLAVGHGQTRLIEAGLYQVRVFESDTVHTLEEYDTARTPINAEVYLESQTTYYGSIQGIAHSNMTVFYPPTLIVFPRHQPPVVQSPATERVVTSTASTLTALHNLTPVTGLAALLAFVSL